MKLNLRRIGGTVILSLALLLAVLPASTAFAETPNAWYTDIFVYTAPTKTVYAVGEAFDASGMEIAGHLQRADGSTATYRLGNARYSTSPFTSAGTKTVAITCSCVSKSGEMQDLTTSVTVKVLQKQRDEWVSDIYVWKNPNKMTYNCGESFDPAGMCVLATYKVRDTTPDFYTEDCTAKCYYSHGTLDTPGTAKITIYCDLPNENDVTTTFKTTLKVNVNEVGDAPSFTTGKALPNGTVGESYSYYVKASGTRDIEYGQYYNPGRSNAMPDGLRFSSSGSGHVKGTPTKEGTFSFWAYAANDFGEDYSEFTITVDPAPEPTKAPAPTKAPVPEATEPQATDAPKEAELAVAAPEHAHSFSEDWKSDAVNHFHECAECGEKTDAAEHTVANWVTVVEPTESADGKQAGACTECGHIAERAVQYQPSQLNEKLLIALIAAGGLLIASAIVIISLARKAKRK